MPDAQLHRLLDQLLGEPVETVPGTLPDLDAYRDQPAPFAVEVLKRRLLDWQRDALDAFALHDPGLHCWVSANGCGKTALLAVLLVYVATVLKGEAIYFSATERQTRASVLKEVRRLVAAAGLPLTVYNYGVTLPHGGAIVLATAGEVDAMQGHHAADLLLAADEAQALDEDQLAACLGCVVGDANRLILAGNPLQVGTPFHRIATTGAGAWRQVVVDAFQVADDTEAPAMPGVITRAGIERLRQSFGEDSARFQSRVWARFPAQPADAMFPAWAIQAAFARWRDEAWRREHAADWYTLGIDVAGSEGGDETVVAIARGGVVDRLAAWREADQMRNVGRVVDLLDALGVRPADADAREAALAQSAFAPLLATRPGDPTARHVEPPHAVLRVDAIGLGQGLDSRLKERGYDVVSFNASRRCEDDEARERFQNQRAEAFDRLRTMLVTGEVAFPYDELLEEELRTCSAFTNSGGRLQVISKKEWRELLQPRRSPDRLDAVVMAVAAPLGLTLAGFYGATWAAL